MALAILTLAASSSAAQEKPSSATPPNKTTTSGDKQTSDKQPELEAGSEWLFNGQNLEGWEGKLAWFRIEAAAVVAGSLQEKIPNNEFLCTKKSYDNFELRLQVKLTGQGNNAGVQFRSQRVPNHHEVSGYQCDAGGAFNRSVWGALYDESRRNKMLAEGPAEKVKEWTRTGDWNDLWIRCEGPRIQLWLNGHQTVDYTEADDKIPRTGIIGLQIHSGPPTEAWYRAVRIRQL